MPRTRIDGGLRVAFLAPLALLGLLAGAAQAEPASGELSHQISAVLPRPPAAGFELEDVDGKKHSLSGYAGKVVVVNFWAVWCLPCRQEMPSFEHLRQILKDDPFEVIAVNQAETSDTVAPFLQGLDPRPTFPVLLDLEMAVASQWGVTALPATYIVDKNGRLAYRALGGRQFDHPEVVEAIRQLVAE